MSIANALSQEGVAPIKENIRSWGTNLGEIVKLSHFVSFCTNFYVFWGKRKVQSGREDSNLRPLAPH
jgi:hypothetical protein